MGGECKQKDVRRKEGSGTGGRSSEVEVIHIDSAQLLTYFTCLTYSGGTWKDMETLVTAGWGPMKL